MKIGKEEYAGHVQLVSAGKTIYSEGELGSVMYLIIEGEVEISKRIFPTSKNLTVLRPGNVFGETALIEQTVRSDTANARGSDDKAFRAGLLPNDTESDYEVPSPGEPRGHREAEG